MQLTNTRARFGTVSKTFHWLIALGILAMLPLGLIASQLPYDTSEQLARKAFLFSVHKTLGVGLFAVALLRILWAAVQPRPLHLAPQRSVETVAADVAHWLLYGALVAVPLTGWVHHAATEGFAPIWLPIGQNLPFVPESAAVAAVAGSLHWLSSLVLALTLVGHVAGALTHHFVLKDDTLRRMGVGPLRAAPASGADRHPASLALALAIWAGAFGAAWGTGAFSGAAPVAPAAPVAQLPQADSGWEVTEGRLSITVQQFGAPVTGRFDSWTAAIRFDDRPDADAAARGDVRAEIAIGSLTLGSVTAQALGADFFDAAQFPTAAFEARIREAGAAYEAAGTLTIKGATIPVTLPFTLLLDGDTARMEGRLTLDRRDFGIGLAMTDPAQLAPDVTVEVTLTATRGTGPDGV